MDDPDRTLEYLKQVELAGQDVVQTKQEIVTLDRRRNEAREGASALQNSSVDKTWMSFGSLLVKMTKTQALSLLKKDIEQVNIDVNKVRSDLKVKVNHLRDVERQPPVPGLMLNPLDRTEVQALTLLS